MNKHDLWSYHQQIVQLQQSNSVIAFLNKGRIADFYKEWGGIIEGIVRDIKRIQEKHFVIEEGKIKTDEEKKPVYQEGKSAESFDAEFGELMKQGAHVKFSSLILT